MCEDTSSTSHSTSRANRLFACRTRAGPARSFSLFFEIQSARSHLDENATAIKRQNQEKPQDDVADGPGERGHIRIADIGLKAVAIEPCRQGHTLARIVHSDHARDHPAEDARSKVDGNRIRAEHEERP